MKKGQPKSVPSKNQLCDVSGGLQNARASKEFSVIPCKYTVNTITAPTL